MEPIRIVLGEDHALMRDGTRQILEQHPDLRVVGEAGDGERLLELVRRLQPDVLILDIRMPGLSGVEVAASIAQSSHHTKVLALTAYDDDDYVLALLEAGASGYMLKTARASELVDAVRRVYRGELVLHPSIAVKLGRLFHHPGASPHHELPTQLSHREIEVLELAARGLRNKAIAEQLGISMRTVEGHFNSILARLGMSSRLEAVLHGLAQGWFALDNRDHQR